MNNSIEIYQTYPEVINMTIYNPEVDLDRATKYIQALGDILDIPEDEYRIPKDCDEKSLIEKAHQLEYKYLYGGEKSSLGKRLTSTSRKLGWDYEFYDIAVVLIRDGIGTFDNTAEDIVNGKKQIVDCSNTLTKIDIIPDNWNPETRNK
jgi:hypothetical protein